MEYRDYYKIMGIERNANADEVKRAFRNLALKYHPDRNPGNKSAEEKYKEISEAYEVLRDPQRRTRYDRIGDSYIRWKKSGKVGNFNWEDWFSKSHSRNRTSVESASEDIPSSTGNSFSEFFTLIFGGGAQKNSTRSETKKTNYEHPININLEEAYSGTERTIHVEGRPFKVKIPAGSKTGTKVRMAGAGPSDPKGQKQDLLLVVHVSPDVRFEIDGEDLYTEIEIDIYMAVLGGQVKVPTPGGDILLTIPAGTQPDQTFRITDRGMPRLHNPQQRGNLFTKVKILIPRNLSAKQHSLFEQLRQQPV